ncbi:MAG: group II intron maturase-specific domain-containing protein [Methanobacterium sp.]
MGFYFQETVDENGLESSIKIIPTEGSIEKVIENIEKTVSLENEIPEDENRNQALEKVIKNIYKVVDPWVNYYKHTNHTAGLERIEQSLNETIKGFI